MTPHGLMMPLDFRGAFSGLVVTVLLLLAANVGLCQERPMIDDSGARRPLERYELCGLRYIKFRRFIFWKSAEILAPDGKIHSAKIGEFMGKNVGVVTKITSDSIRLLEIVPDGAGGWREREAKIQIEPLDNKSNNSFKPTPDAGCVEPNMGLVRQ